MSPPTVHDLRAGARTIDKQDPHEEELAGEAGNEASNQVRITGPQSRKRGKPKDSLSTNFASERGSSARKTTRRRSPARKSTSKTSRSSEKPTVTNPIIGITCSFQRLPSEDKHDYDYYYLYEPYVAAIHNAGGVPVIIPVGLGSRYPSRISNILDGLLISGGGDMDPNLYHDLLTPKLRKVEPMKDRTEIDLFNLAFNRNIPILGICRGAQVINVALDGTLYQDITSQVRMALEHDPAFPHAEPCHEVFIEKDTKLHKALGESSIWTNSWHHQSIKLHGKGLVVNARASDDIIEGIEHPHKKWVIGVQWHPELMWQDDKIQDRLFKSFVDACKS